MAFRRSKKSPIIEVPAAESPYELHRSLPNPLFEDGLQPRRSASRGQYAPAPMEQPKPKARWKKRLLSVIIFLVIACVAVGGWVGWKFVENEVKVFGWRGLWSLLFPGKLKGEDSGHVNILLVGDSADDPGHAGAELTDSIMLVSINTKDYTAFTLSIPRDLYVNIPNNGYAKVNEAYQDGKAQHFSASGYPSGGLGLLEEVVSQKLGVTIDYYALVNYTAFRDAVNAVGGVNVTIKSSDPRGVYDPNTNTKLPNGVVKLNGVKALDLARSRGDGYGSYGVTSDFDRTQYQRQMLVALKDKATSLSVLSNPFRMADLFDAVGKNVKTDLPLGGVRRLYTITKKIPSSKITSASLNSANYKGQKDVDLLQSYLTISGQSALIPTAGIDNYTQIDDYVNQLTGQ